ncbi:MULTISPECIES: glycerol-3-phosphate 1-O-acyltransferase PlsY [unclassified Nitratiruptor]|uniref:glycerol-3-phosphate 1-O-acyltransferase PlsY n=1 Tax=unclassified Nitratiruptor TaxID=2624044 RepID=UPI00191531C2|nr:MULTISPECIES: glycerol-3-phosphate 1-O-acyltransferase PlsY [unclassified Nitratiruptor]BCD59751.1 acyl phosphate:glycerol-3-phosphate acyltransferase [Nitratiruptor sp. YY08-10]BCD63675.1 acyl phosphate:glycerol-3-phosphate acyltransferase [Nitratiruptor sp. YY08-14]
MDFFTNPNVLFYITAYLVGGIPFGYILAKIFAGVDIKQSGSKSIGATNVLRVVKEKDPKLAKKLAIATVVFDALKGAVLVLIAKWSGFPPATWWLIGIMTVLGHCYSPFLKFEGGKGVATGMGVLLVLLPMETIIGFITWLIVAKTTKISSLSSLSGLVAVILASFIIHPDMPYVHSHAPLLLLAFIIFYKHLPNIKRLLTGQEGKVAA